MVDGCIYHKVCGINYIFLILYVNDILHATNDITLLHNTKIFLFSNLEMKFFGDCSFVSGIEIFLMIFSVYHKRNYIEKNSQKKQYERL